MVHTCNTHTQDAERKSVNWRLLWGVVDFVQLQGRGPGFESHCGTSANHHLALDHIITSREMYKRSFQIVLIPKSSGSENAQSCQLGVLFTVWRACAFRCQSLVCGASSRSGSPPLSDVLRCPLSSVPSFLFLCSLLPGRS